MDTLAALPTADLFTEGWECLGHSRVGHSKGLREHRSALFNDLVRVITLCLAQNDPNVGYLLKNVNNSDDTRDNVVLDSQTIRYVLGTNVLTACGRFGPTWSSHANFRRSWS